ncbi:MAG: phosphoenolpyruvate carboxykinase (GTP) [Candidatus Geothermincolia bacterium]
MRDENLEYLQGALDADQYSKLEYLGQPEVNRFIAETVRLCKPSGVFIATDSEADREHVKQNALKEGEEHALAIDGHTYHFDGIRDQGRDKENTRFLLPPDVHLGEHINSKSREEGLEEILGLLDGLMAGKTMIVRFYCLGPRRSAFSQLCCQITDSFYVSHSEDLLYRAGYEEFVRVADKCEFFRFLHAAGRVENGVCLDIDKRRVYIDLEENTVYSVNTQYGGNSMGLKKLAMRLGIQKGLREGWLTEHMFAVGVPGPGGRKTYMTGAFPSMCGKTSTAMIQGQTIVGDDIVYLKKIGGELRAVNVESGIFGIIQDVNPVDDPAIYKALTTPGEVIFSNVLVRDGKPYWLGMGSEIPETGTNFSGEWTRGKTDTNGSEIDPSHKNARFTISLHSLLNTDESLDDPNGVPIKAMIFGGRDTDTSVPVEESFNWVHGVITKAASLESESTAATLGAEGVRTFNPMSNLEFLAASLDTYIQKYLEFPAVLAKPPKIFAVNYFLMKDGNYLNGMVDKRVWMLWMEERVHGECGALLTPTGYIPLYKDLRRLFATALGFDYTEKQYREQFTVRIPELLAKLARVEEVYRREWGIPEVLFVTLDEQRERLEKARSELGDYVSPLLLSQA